MASSPIGPETVITLRARAISHSRCLTPDFSSRARRAVHSPNHNHGRTRPASSRLPLGLKCPTQRTNKSRGDRTREYTHTQDNTPPRGDFRSCLSRQRGKSANATRCVYVSKLIVSTTGKERKRQTPHDASVGRCGGAVADRRTGGGGVCAISWQSSAVNTDERHGRI